VMNHLHAVVLLASALAIGVATPARAADKPGCQDPSWAPERMRAFDIADCADKAWMSMDVDTTDGTKHLEGERRTVDYNLTDENKSPSNDALRKFFADQGKKAGAQLTTDPDGGWTAVLTKPSPDGDLWYMYTHGSGNADTTDGFTLTTVTIKPLPQEVTVQDSGDPLPTDSANCKNPPWLVKQFDYFKLDSCSARVFDRVVLGLPDGDKTVAGHVYTATYALTDEAKAPVALAVRNNYVTALQKLGATFVSDPGRSTEAVLTRTTPAGHEVWYEFHNSAGNDDDIEAYGITTVEIAPMPQEVEVRDTPAPLEARPGAPCADPPWLVKQFDAFKRTDCSFRDLDQITLDLANGEKKTLAGRILDTNYTLSDEHKVGVTFVLHDNYVNALEKIGAQLASDPSDMNNAILTRSTPDGEYWYIYAHTAGNDQETSSYALTTVQIGGPPPKACTIEVYGVNFDFDKSTLRPDSEPVLKQVLALFAGDADYAAEIGGHTDNIGQKAYNMKLSDERAQSVKAWLASNGIAATRMSTAGYGDTRPLVPNDSDDNRAKNRRVELKRQNCKT
jgi:outer membrane protein OmpA-like peptidoglycan-associated protein